jgi:hypothetical protein
VATEEVGIRLSLQGRREAAAGLSGTTKELEQVADSAEDVDKAGREAAKGLEKASDKKFAKGFASIRRGAAGLAGFLGRGLVKAAKVGAVALGAATVAAGAMSVKAIGLASDAAETGSAFKTVLGPSARGVQKDLNRLSRRFGIYNADLQQAATGFATLGKQAGKGKKELSGFSTDLVRAGLDLGSFYNASPEDAFKAIQSGLTGEAESLKRFNIFMSDAALNAFALQKGLSKTTQEMTDQEKIALRQAFILANLGDAQGDLARTAEGYANQQRGLTGRTQTFLKLLGGPMMTAGTGAFQGLNSIAKAGIKLLRQNLPAVQAHAERLSEKFATLGKTWAQDLPGAIDTLMNRWDTLKASFSGFSAGDTSVQMGTLKDNVVALGPAIAAAKDQLPGISDALAVTNVVTGFLADHVDTLARYMPWLAAGFVAVKVAQMAANIVTAASLPLRLAEVIATRQLVKANKELIAAQGAARVSTVAGAATSGVATAATTTQTGATRGLNAALRANPIGLVITALMLLVGGLVLAYKKSDTFRGIVDKMWGAVKTAGVWIGNLIKKAGEFMLKWTPLGRLVTTVRDNFDSVRSAVDRVIGSFKSAWEWAGKLGEKLSNIPGAAFLGDVAGGIGGIFGGGRAYGGPVAAGVGYKVGERGAETFVPAVSGVVVPNISTTPDVDFGDDDFGSAPPPSVHVYLDGEEVTTRVLTRLDTRVAFA